MWTIVCSALQTSPFDSIERMWTFCVHVSHLRSLDRGDISPVQCWGKSSWNTAYQNAFKRAVFKQSSAKPSGARLGNALQKGFFPNPTLLLNPAHAGKMLTVAVSYRFLWLHVTKRHKAPGRQAACSPGTRMDHWWLLQHFVADSTS